jgi:hypothetical protein
MNINQIKNKLDSFQKSTSTKSNSNSSFKDILWKPSVGKQNIRVVPSKYNSEMPFTEMLFYYGIGKKMMPSLKNWGEKDPIAEFAKQLRKGDDKEGWRLAKKLDPKMRIFCPIIVRGEEEKGVRLWQFGVEIYQTFLQLAVDEEVGDFTDVENGRDIKLVTVGPEVTKNEYNKTTISPSMKSTPLSNKSEEMESWLNEQPNVKEMFKPFSYDEMKAALQEYLTVGEDNNDEETTSTSSENESAPKFDDLFKE